MELIKKNIHMENRKKGPSLQMKLDGNYVFSERNPNAIRIVQKKGSVKIDEIKEYEDFVFCKGAFTYEILYLTDNSEHKLYSIAAELPFEENIKTEKLMKNVTVSVSTEIENFTVKLVSDRKIQVQTLFDIYLEMHELEESELTIDIEDSNSVEMQKEEWEYAKIISSSKEIVKIKEEFAVPEGNANIGKIIWKNVRLQDLEYSALDGKIQYQAILNVFFMYEAEDISEGIQSFEMSKAITGFIESPDCNEKAFLHVKEYSKNLQLESRQDFDGEDRIFYVELGIYNCISIYKNEKEYFVTDAYAIGKKVNAVLTEMNSERILNPVKGQIRVEEECNKSSNIVEILRTDCEISSIKCEIKNKNLCIRGILQLNLLCKTESENEEYTSVVREIPFESMEERADLNGDEQLCIAVSIQQIHSFTGSEQISFNCILQYKVLIIQKFRNRMVTEMLETVNVEMNKLPAVAVIYAKENEKIWEIGKEYEISQEEIKNLNELKSDVLKEGQKIMICRENL